MWKCSCPREHFDAITICPRCNDTPPYALTTQQAAIAGAVLRLMRMGLKYGEFLEAPAGWERRRATFVKTGGA